MRPRGRAKGIRARVRATNEVKRSARKGTQTTKTSGTARIQRVPAGSRRESARVGYLWNGSYGQTVCMSKIVTRERTRLGIFASSCRFVAWGAEAVKTLDVIQPSSCDWRNESETFHEVLARFTEEQSVKCSRYIGNWRAARRSPPLVRDTSGARRGDQSDSAARRPGRRIARHGQATSLPGGWQEKGARDRTVTMPFVRLG